MFQRNQMIDSWNIISQRTNLKKTSSHLESRCYIGFLRNFFKVIHLQDCRVLDAWFFPWNQRKDSIWKKNELTFMFCKVLIRNDSIIWHSWVKFGFKIISIFHKSRTFFCLFTSLMTTYCFRKHKWLYK